MSYNEFSQPFEKRLVMYNLHCYETEEERDEKLLQPFCSVRVMTQHFHSQVYTLKKSSQHAYGRTCTTSIWNKYWPINKTVNKLWLTYVMRVKMKEIWIFLKIQICQNKNHWIIYFKWVNCIVFKFYLNKAVNYKNKWSE